MNKKDIGNILLIFIAWKLVIFTFADLGQIIFPLQTNFLGGGLLNYLRHPLFWGFINFDGEHYLSIARDGYLPLTHFFFPFYPFIIKVLSVLFGGSFNTYAFTGLLLSNSFLFVALIGMIRLGNLILNKETSYFSIILLLLFPTSFYLGAYYNESLFLAIAVWSFYFAFTKRWLLSFLFCGLLSATRLVGIALIPALLYEFLIEGKNRLLNIKSTFYLFLSSFGIIAYSIYLKATTGDFFAFFKNIEIFGDQRSSSVVILPQVFYRYFIKILPNINYRYFPIVFTTYLEIFSAIIFLILGYFVYVKMKKSIFIYCVLAYLIPTFSGSFSSFPRYVLALFPIFIILGDYISKKSKPLRFIIFSLLLLSSFFAVALFNRGFFIS